MSEFQFTIRPPRHPDLPAITAIYNAGIVGRAATFEEQTRQPHELESWIDAPLPVLIAENRDGKIVGFARIKPFSDREVFTGVGDHGIYVAPGHERQGIGGALLDAIADAAAAQGLWKLTSRIFKTNVGSVAAHRAAGFRVVGIQERHARLDGIWRDVVLVERLIGAATDPDAPSA